MDLFLGLISAFTVWVLDSCRVSNVGNHVM